MELLSYRLERETSLYLQKPVCRTVQTAKQLLTNRMVDITEKIAAARKEAETLKERIKQKKDALADTTRNVSFNDSQGSRY